MSAICRKNPAFTFFITGMRWNIPVVLFFRNTIRWNNAPVDWENPLID
jgi:hypothetical protein